jgi:hypothetical protein
MGSICVSELRPRTFIYPPDDARVNVEQRWNDTDGRSPKGSDKILSQSHPD